MNLQKSDVKTADTMEVLHTVYEKYKDVVNGLHDLLWQIIVNKVTAGKLCCFTCNYTTRGLVVGIAHANEHGYQPTPAWFVKGTPYDDAVKVLEGMTKEVFGLEPEVAFQIILTSMRSNDNKTTFVLLNEREDIDDVEEMTEEDAIAKNKILRQLYSKKQWVKESDLEK